MTLELIQDVSVTIVALAAAAVVLRRVIACVQPSRPQAGCSSCASPHRTCAATAQPSGTVEAVPVQLLRRLTPRSSAKVHHQL